MAKHDLYNTFQNSLVAATGNIQPKYFKLPVNYQEELIYRERVYCYELYHQIRLQLPQDYPYVLSGEVHKIGHINIVPHCGEIIPDLLVHNPGKMGPDDNLVIVEIKSIVGANFNAANQGLLKDIDTINCMTSIDNGYYRGIILVYGSGNEDKKAQIEHTYRNNCNTERILLLFHNNPMEQAVMIQPNP